MSGDSIPGVVPGRLLWHLGGVVEVDRVTPSGRFVAAGRDHNPDGSPRGTGSRAEPLRREHADELLGRPVVARLSSAAERWAHALQSGRWSRPAAPGEYLLRALRVRQELSGLIAELELSQDRARELAEAWRAAGHLPSEEVEK